MHTYQAKARIPRRQRNNDKCYKPLPSIESAGKNIDRFTSSGILMYASCKVFYLCSFNKLKGSLI